MTPSADESSTKRAHPKSQGQDIILTLQRKVQLVEQRFTQHTKVVLISQEQNHYLPKKQVQASPAPVTNAEKGCQAGTQANS